MGKNKKVKSSVGTYMYEYQLNTDLLDSRREFYRIDERLGLESRSVVCKNGPGFIQHQFRQNVAKYLCAFVNSAEDGTLMLGVDESGIVTGYYSTRYEEDSLKRDIDEAVKDIQPVIFVGDYNVKLVPVYNNGGTQPIRDLYVIEVFVSGAKLGAKDKLYETKQGVFIRGKDGELEGPLSATSIQEWTRRRFKSELDKLRQREDRLRQELATSQTGSHDKERQLRLKEEELAKRESDITSMESGHKRHVDSLESRNRQLQTENQSLKNSGESIRQEVSDIKRLLLLQNKQQSRSCVIS